MRNTDKELDKAYFKFYDIYLDIIKANERNIPYIGISKFLEFFAAIQNTYTE